jgi:AraC-like DNA-binding protein
VALAVGDMALYSSVERYRLDFDASFAQTVLMFPAAVIRSLHPDIDMVLGTLLEGAGPLAQLLTTMADQCFRVAGSALGQASSRHLSDAMAQTLVAATMQQGALAPSAKSNLRRFHVRRIQQYVLDHLADATLSVASVAAALELSPAHIHRLFQDEPKTFGAWLLGCRLRAVQLDLSHPAKAHLSISQIAFGRGFNNAAHFSRVFRAEFGMTAKEWRARSAAGLGGRANGQV